jgi:chemotaxis protein MotB
VADDDTTNDLPSDQDVDDTLNNSESDGDESLEVRAGDDALVDEGVIDNKPSSEDPPETECPPCKGGAPAWMATFADMATLLMAFFVLLLSFAETEVPKFKQVAGSLKQAFGIEKIVPKVTIPMARSVMVENFTPAVAERSVIDQKE